MKAKKTADQLMVSSIALVAASLVLFGFAFYLWQRDITKNPEKLFWAAMDQALSTTGVTRTVSQKGDLQDFSQEVTLRFSGKVQSDTTVTATDPTSDSRVVTETLGLPGADYLRYLELRTASAGLNEEIKGKWSQLPVAEGESGQFLAEALMNTALFTGNFNYKSRHEFLDLLRDTKVYSVKDIVSQGRDVDGRKATVITISLDPTSYTEALKKYLELQGLGKVAAGLNTDLPSTGEIQMEVAIHAPSRQFVRLGIPTVDIESAEKYSDWGVYEAQEIPDSPISYDQFEGQVLKGNN